VLQHDFGFKLEDPTWNIFEYYRNEDINIAGKQSDDAYDFYVTFNNYASAVDTLYHFEYEFLNVLPLAWKKAKSIFFELGNTPLAISGNIDSALIQFSDDLSTSTDIETLADNFKIEIRQKVLDMSSELKALSDYVRLIKEAGSITGESWTIINTSKEIKPLLIEYAQVMSTQNDVNQKKIGYTLQLSNSLTDQMLRPDKANIEMVMSKNTKISFNGTNIRQELLDIKADLL
jgi:hypothetical protein